MNRSRSIRSIPVVLLVLVSVLGCTTTATQQQEQTADPDTGLAAVTPDDDPAAASVEEIPRERENPPREQPFTYDPGNRRDPFVSPLEALEEQRGPRPSGIAGMSVDDLDLTGIVTTPDAGGVAYVTGSDGSGYLLRVGDSIYRARVLAIDAEAGTISFREQVDDPRSIKTYRDRVLRLGSGSAD